VKPAFFASLMDSGLRYVGVLKLEMIFCTDLLQAGHFSSGLAETGRRSVKPGPPHGLQSPFPSQSSYSYIGISAGNQTTTKPSAWPSAG
jgi:hypothetical protein